MNHNQKRKYDTRFCDASYLALSAALLLLPPLLLEDVQLAALLQLQDRAADRRPERGV